MRGLHEVYAYRLFDHKNFGNGIKNYTKYLFDTYLRNILCSHPLSNLLL